MKKRSRAKKSRHQRIVERCIRRGHSVEEAYEIADEAILGPVNGAGLRTRHNRAFASDREAEQAAIERRAAAESPDEVDLGTFVEHDDRGRVVRIVSMRAWGSLAKRG